MRKQECVIKVPGLNEKFRFKVPDHMSIAEVISLLAVLIKEEYPEAEISVDASCCAGVTVETHQAALLTMKMCQVDVTATENV